MTQTWDVVVVGAGPCGAVAARSLVARGWRVALVDRHAFPRQKVCGDALLPDSFEILRGLGLAYAVLGAGHPSSVL
ncbi:MAG TPA: FAD-dependent oxidoreductase, partial [Verrucomicrobiota bacterium]|nr:FAD-dependent oxidoreductase [Verrucomicrobiota bacterium]